MSAPILLSIENRIATITLNRPEVMNAINEEMLPLWVDALEQCRSSSDDTTCTLSDRTFGFQVHVVTGHCIVQRDRCIGGQVHICCISIDRTCVRRD